MLTLSHMAKRPPILGIGSGERQNIEPYGLDFSHPVGRLEEALRIMRLCFYSQGLICFEIENKSSMPHPMHLHGHFFRVDNGTGRGPLKDTVLVEPKDRLAKEWVADNLGDWAFHCHQVYHAERGMTRVVKVA
jgi:hypothetical protein